MLKLEKLDRRHGVLPTSQKDNEDTGISNDDSASKSRRGRRDKIKCGRIILLVTRLLIVVLVVSAITTVVIATNTRKRGTPFSASSLLSTMSRSRSQSQPPPRKMSQSENPVYFLHIGKAGGTSVDKLMFKILKRRNRHRKYVGHKHFDWSFIEKSVAGAGADPDSNADVITFLRNPVSRAVSQFYFSQSLPWAKKRNAPFIHQTLDEYLKNPGGYRQPIHDGAGGVDFLSGSASVVGGGWIQTDGVETELKQYLREHMAANALYAARNLDRTTWFGLLEDIPRSMKLLQLTLDLDEVPTLPRSNTGAGRRRRHGGQQQHKQNRIISAESVSIIESYIPGDIWLYQYSKLLFEARWNYLTGETEIYLHPELPLLPQSLQTTLNPEDCKRKGEKGIKD